MIAIQRNLLNQSSILSYSKQCHFNAHVLLSKLIVCFYKYLKDQFLLALLHLLACYIIYYKNLRIKINRL